MERQLYLECYSGISGDMTVAALLDLGASQSVLNRALSSLKVPGFQIEIKRVKKAGLDLCDFNVILDKRHENHDHDMEYLYMHHEHHGEYHEENGEHSHEHGHVSPHEHRGLPEILAIIENGDMTDHAKEIATKIFQIIGEAEAKAHGVSLEEVHFHEVGAVDSIVDIVAVAVCLDDLHVTDVIVPELYEGRGSVRCQHGVIPIPVPAVLAIAQQHHLNLHLTDTMGELVTPTGAAIVAAVRTKEQLPAKFTVEKTGMGAGKRTYDRPSMVRAMLIREVEETADTIVRLETNIDDCTGEALGYVMDRLFEAGARDVHYTPVFMKKNRPAYQLNVICREEERQRLEQIIFEETTTIGIRRVDMKRTVLKRDSQTMETSLGSVKVKICQLENQERMYPEYDSVVEICGKKRLSFQEAFARIQSEIQK